RRAQAIKTVQKNREGKEYPEPLRVDHQQYHCAQRYKQSDRNGFAELYSQIEINSEDEQGLNKHIRHVNIGMEPQRCRRENIDSCPNHATHSRISAAQLTHQ